MLWLTSLSIALAGNLVIDARVPAEVYVDAQPIAKLYYPGILETELQPGNLPALIYMNGADQKLTLDIPASGKLRLILGRTGISTGTIAESNPQPIEGHTRKIQVRAVGSGPIQVRMGNQRLELNPGSTADLSLSTGAHEVTIRSTDSQIIWAKGTLQLGVGSDLVFQASEGRMPELSGENADFITETR